METQGLSLHLPPGIISLTLSFLAETWDISDASRVSRAWYELAFPYLHQHITIRASCYLEMLIFRLESEANPEYQVRSYLRALTITPDVNLNLSSSYNYSLLIRFEHAISHLVRLELLEWDCRIPPLSMAIIDRFRDHCPLLRSLIVHRRCLSSGNVNRSKLVH
ncbi:hypothetical protein B0J17DRAFT_350372 [Rhizoctonia solani]|nr:hypothetical protein B0J17DRAFT_350372 [Rhizoctonia solani]